MSDQPTLAERASSCFSSLTIAATELNIVSDELGKWVARIDDGLRNLNLGITTWVVVFSGEGDRDLQDPTYWSEDLGYAKINGKWGICLRRVDGDYRDPDRESETQWPFNDAPRALRLIAIDKVPELLEALSTQAAKTAKTIQGKLADVRVVAEAVNPSRVARVPILGMPLNQIGLLVPGETK